LKFEILGYLEQGTTTTPWMMLSLNDADRFTIAQRAVSLLTTAAPNHDVVTRAHKLQSWYLHRKKEMAQYAFEHGEDSPDVAANAASKTLGEA
jgi:xylulose-5-phosphate/fructose-6-phosphate phosphoketolase